MEILILFFLILLNGLFSMSEVAVISARKSSLKYDALKGNKLALNALGLTENMDQFLSTVQVGITLIGILTGIYSGDVLASKFTPLLVKCGLSSGLAYSVSQVFIVIVVTYLTILLGELIPKRIGMGSAEKVAKIIAKPMCLFTRLTYPFVWVLSKSTTIMYSFFRLSSGKTKITEEEIKAIIEEGKEDGEVQPVEQEIVERVFTLGDRELKSVMTPKGEIVALDVRLTKDELKKAIKLNAFNKYPVIDGSLDQVVGVIYLYDLFLAFDEDEFVLENIVRQAPCFYENMDVYLALDRMKRESISFAFVIDDLGMIIGLVTLKDIMEALVGEFPSLKEKPKILKLKEESFLVEGQCSFYVFLDFFQMGALYSEYPYQTLSGLILDELKSIPKKGDRLQWFNFSLEIVEMDGVRIDKILVTQLAI